MKLKQFFNNPNRWIQNRPVQYGTSNKVIACCLSGAIQHRYKNDDKATEIENKLYKYIKSSAHTSIEAYNDNPRRKFIDIVRLVNKLDI